MGAGGGSCRDTDSRGTARLIRVETQPGDRDHRPTREKAELCEEQGPPRPRGWEGAPTHAFPLEKIRNKLREAELSDLVNPYSRPKRLPRNGVPGRPQGS